MLVLSLALRSAGGQLSGDVKSRLSLPSTADFYFAYVAGWAPCRPGLWNLDSMSGAEPRNGPVDPFWHPEAQNVPIGGSSWSP
jgi:hypothetical protein